MDTLVEDLLSQIECPVCFEYMIPPITLCINGHNICENCKPGFANCPTCRGTLLENVRNHIAETISRSITHACRYRKSGCTGQFLVEIKKEHENVCRFRPKKCPFYLVNKCDWKGPLIHMASHIRKTHAEPGHQRDVNGFFFNIEISFPTMSRSSTNWYQALNILDEFFFFHCKKMDNVIYITLMFVGEEEDAKRYSYDVTLKSTDDVPDTMSAHLRCRSYLQLNRDILQKRLYAAFPVYFVESCLNEEGKFVISFGVFDFHIKYCT